IAEPIIEELTGLQRLFGAVRQQRASEAAADRDAIELELRVAIAAMRVAGHRAQADAHAPGAVEREILERPLLLEAARFAEEPVARRLRIVGSLEMKVAYRERKNAIARKH